MSRLIETIRFEEGWFNNLNYHEQRMNVALREVFGVQRNVNLEVLLKRFPKPGAGLYKCRIVYDNKMDHAEFIPYSVRPVKTLKLIHDDTILYEHKFENRTILEDHFNRRGDCDDILIVKNRKITDTSYGNIVFRKGRYWVTPASCLLPGTMRQSLLDRKLIQEKEIEASGIAHFESFKLINAMLLFDGEEVSIKNIIG